ncbi:uncharacterized protein [Physcomitrium patens]|uniref:uncharacterized protein n=1 Tax=Physcomitrium patens TaxID=3218 RepID=UPI003CCE3A7A
MTFPSGKSRGLVEKGAHMANAVEDLRERGRREPWTVRWLKIRGDRSPRCGKMGRESVCCDVAGGICDPLATYRRLGSVQLAFCIGLCAQATFNRRNPAITAKKIAELEVVVKDQVLSSLYLSVCTQQQFASASVVYRFLENLRLRVGGNVFS